MGLILLFPPAGAGYSYSAFSQTFTFGSTVGARVNPRVAMPITFGSTVRWRADSTEVAATRLHPDIVYEVAFDSQPLDPVPDWEVLSERLRGLGAKRGRSYEFDRMETGTMEGVLENLDSELSPENTASQYAPIRSTRPVRAFLTWDTSYALFRGITEGFPQTYRSYGKDSLVSLRGNDLFYALNNTRFTLGSTTLTSALTIASENNLENVYVANTGLPMPQVPPFEVTVTGPTADWPTETMTVLSIGTGVWWTERSANPQNYPVGSTVSTNAVSFGQAYSGERIRQVLEAVGFNFQWYDLDEGQSLIAPSSDLAAVSPLEHINQVVEAEFGRFFVSRPGLFTFRDRHSIIVDYLDPVFTFRDGAVTGGGSGTLYGEGLYGEGAYSSSAGGEVPFVLDGEISHSEEKLYNRVKITIQGGDYSGQVVDVSDQDSIDEHFERIFEKTFPYANPNDADSAARFVLARNAEATLRLPGISVKGAYDPVNLWPQLLGREIGDRVRFRYQPEGGGDEIDMALAIDGISHAIRPGDHVVTFQCTEVDSTQYWILGLAGYTELDQTTKVGF